MEFRHQTSLCLSIQQASRITSLWRSLDEADKQQAIFAARHHKRFSTGQFSTPKKQTSVMKSTIHYPLGATSEPAQRPDCSPLMENIFVRLCNIHQSPVGKGKRDNSRWSLILRDYCKIRHLVIGNTQVMQGTEIQLVEVNQNTLIQWHNDRQKGQELSRPTLLLQATTLPSVLPKSEEPLQEAKVLPAEPIPAQQEHQHQLLESTAGQAPQRQTASDQLPHPIMPKGPVKRQLLSIPPGSILKPQILTPAGLIQVVLPVSVVQGTRPQTGAPIITTLEALTIPKRAYKRTVEANTCKKCRQFRTAETGHSQFRGRVYCPLIETLTKYQWLEEMKEKFSKKLNNNPSV